MLHEGLLKLLGYEIPVSWTVMYMCNLGEDGKYKSEGQTPDKVLIAAAKKKAITKKWGREGIPTQDQWTHQVEEIHTMEKIKAPPETV